MTHRETLYDHILQAQKGDIRIKEKIIEDNMGLVHKVASRFYGKGTDREDLHQIGCIGLIKAIERFDTSKNLCFSTYAVPLIFGELRLYFRDNSIIKVSRSIKTEASRLARLTESFTKQNGRTPKITELAALSDKTPQEVSYILSAVSTVTSVDDIDEKSAFCESFGENIRAELLDLSNAIKTLPARDQKLIRLRYFEEYTQNHTAEKLGISQVQVSRLEKKILNTFREKLKEII